MTPSQTNDHVRETWSFGPYTLDAEGQLLLGPTPIHLAPLQRRLLLALVRRRGQLLTRDNLLLEVWGHSHVNEVSISRTVHGLRRVFADGPLGPSVIRTIYGGGYRLEVPIHARGEGEGGTPQFPTAATLNSFVEGLVLVRQRDPRLLGRAERHLRHCVDTAPGFTPALVQLAATRLALYRWGLLSADSLEPGLEPILRRAEASGHLPDEVLALRVEALSLLHWQPDLAESRFGSWLPGQLAAGAALHSWVRHLLVTGRPAQALTLLEPHLTPDNPDGWMLASTAWWQLGDHDKAIDCLRKQLSLDGDLLAARLLLALQLADSARRAEALRELEASSIDANPANGLQAVVALILALCGKTAPAVARLRAELAQNNRPHTLTSFWGLAALAAGEEAAAATLLEEAVRNRCGLAPFAQTMPGLQRYAQSPALAQFLSAMTNRFRRTF
ncbi:MAG: winged helix-turn-helix domain-containing protein [Cyanobacteriota bacterium]|jgi:DNA-binding winged helix-turn-helix (wHTH) protein/tetratricopeptide (TPR) repeat protein